MRGGNDELPSQTELYGNYKSPLELANQIANSIANAKAAEMNIIIPLKTKQWAEEVIQEFLFDIAPMADQYGVNSKIVDRSLIESDNFPSIEWNQGIKLEDVLPYTDANLDPEFLESIDTEELDDYGDFGIGPAYIRNFFGNDKTKPVLSPQYNRLFPLKIVMRVAVNLLLNRDGVITGFGDDEETAFSPLFLDDLRKESAKVAKYAKDRMQWIDNNKGTNFGSWFSVALTDGSIKQDERFMVQFVGSIRNKGQGLPFELGFLEVDPDGEVKITPLGLKFSLENNPIIDQKEGWKEGNTFTTRERMFLINAIKYNVKGEYELMKEIIELVKKGNNTPNDIEEYLTEKDYSKTESSITRTGLMARLTELGLVEREKKGRNVFYKLIENN